jgi:Cu2+-exporting ATPase
VLVVALGTFLLWALIGSISEAVNHTIALLIVACPCALGLATPLTMAVAIGLAARRQVLIKNAGALEILARGGRMLLDKTGTLTHGRPTLVEWTGPDWLRPAIAQAESRSTHPIAKALVEAFGDVPLLSSNDTPQNVEETHGGGIRAMLGEQELLIGSPMFLAENAVGIQPSDAAGIEKLELAGLTTVGVSLNGRLVGIAALGDQLHKDAAQAIAELKSLHWSASIVSGDASAVVRSVAEQVGIPEDRCFAQVTPENKLAIVTESRQQFTVMVGDGVNDAAALAAADVGIAVEGGAEASLAAADIYIAAPGTMPLVELVKLARRTRRTVRQNLAIALSYNVLFVSLAAAGCISPLVAAILMPISSASVLASAMSITLGGGD